MYSIARLLGALRDAKFVATGLRVAGVVLTAVAQILVIVLA